MKFLAAVLSASILVACGGGGSDAPASPITGSPTPTLPTPASPTPELPPAELSRPAAPATSAELAKYEGTWREDCVDHKRFTKTFSATGSNTLLVATKDEYFENADCTGALVATGSYGVPDENVRYETASQASVTLLNGANVTADANRASSVYAAGATYSITGSGVKSTELVGTTVFARVEYAGGYVIVERPALNGQTTYGALLLHNDELLALVPIVGLTNSFKVNHRYIR